MEASMNKTQIVDINSEVCIGCGVCAGMCPRGILVMSETTGKVEVTDELKCDRLAGCQRACPVGAIKIR